MSVDQRSDPADARLPVWLDWVLYNTQSGLVLLDAEMRIVFANKWFLLRARLAANQVNGGSGRDPKCYHIRQTRIH